MFQLEMWKENVFFGRQHELVWLRFVKIYGRENAFEIANMRLTI